MSSEPPNHESTIERSGTRVDLRITVPAEAVAAEVDKATRGLRSRARIAGFRKGKAPLEMVRQRYADEIREHVTEHLVREHVSAELKARDLHPIEYPVLDDVELDLKGPLTFRVHFDVKPDVEVSGYRGLQATRQLEQVTDEVVERALGQLRERAAKLEPVEGESVSEGDFVRAEISLYPSDRKGRRLAEENRFVHVGHEEAVPGLNDQLPGLSPGDEREFVTTLGDAFPNDMLAGREVVCRVEVGEVKRRRLPAIDDELARDLGLEDLAALREKVREDIVRQAERQADRGVDRQLLDRILEANPVDLPSSMVEDHLDHAVERTARDLARQGVDPREGIDWGSFRAENRSGAERSVAEKLVLDRIAEIEEIEVDDTTVVQEIESSGQAEEGSTAALVQQMRKDGSFEGLRRLLRRQRALDLVRGSATIDTVERPADEASPTTPG